MCLMWQAVLSLSCPSTSWAKQGFGKAEVSLWQMGLSWNSSPKPSQTYRIAGCAAPVWTSLVLFYHDRLEGNPWNRFNTSVISHRIYDPVSLSSFGSVAPFTLHSPFRGWNLFPLQEATVGCKRFCNLFPFKNLILSSIQGMQNSTPPVGTQGTALQRQSP